MLGGFGLVFGESLGERDKDALFEASAFVHPVLLLERNGSGSLGHSARGRSSGRVLRPRSVKNIRCTEGKFWARPLPW